MGLTVAFDLPLRLLRIDCEQQSLAGLSIVYRPPTVAAFDAALAVEDYAPIESLMAEDIRALRPVSEHFGRLIESWNLERNGAAVPVASFLSLDALFVLQVTMTWIRIARGLPQTIPAPAEPSIESSIPMEALAS